MSVHQRLTCRIAVCLLAAGALAGGCKKNVAVPPPPATPAVDPDPLQVAERAYASNDYPTALAAYSETLQSGRESDLVLWRLALLNALSEPRDLALAISHAEKLENAYPESPYRSEAAVLLLLLREMTRLESLQTEQSRQIIRLNSELKQLKEIDLNRRKPPPES